MVEECSNKVSLSVNPLLVAPGDQITVTWSIGKSINPGGWLAAYADGGPRRIWRQLVTERSGSASFHLNHNGCQEIVVYYVNSLVSHFSKGEVAMAEVRARVKKAGNETETKFRASSSGVVEEISDGNGTEDDNLVRLAAESARRKQELIKENNQLKTDLEAAQAEVLKLGASLLEKDAESQRLEQEVNKAHQTENRATTEADRLKDEKEELVFKLQATEDALRDIGEKLQAELDSHREAAAGFYEQSYESYMELQEIRAAYEELEEKWKEALKRLATTRLQLQALEADRKKAEDAALDGTKMATKDSAKVAEPKRSAVAEYTAAAREKLNRFNLRLNIALSALLVASIVFLVIIIQAAH